MSFVETVCDFQRVCLAIWEDCLSTCSFIRSSVSGPSIERQSLLCAGNRQGTTMTATRDKSPCLRGGHILVGEANK